jgi:hypothetical protein
MFRRGTGWLLLALAIALGSLGIWRTWVRLFGTLDDHWMLSSVATDNLRPSTIDRAIRKQQDAAQGDEAVTKRARKWEALVSRSYQLEGSIGVGCLLAAIWFGWLGWRRVLPPEEDQAPTHSLDCSAVGPFPLWVQFAVLHGTRRKVVLAQNKGLAAFAFFVPTSAAFGMRIWGGSTWIPLVVACLAFVAWSWSWLAIRWVDRHGKWTAAL